MTLWSSIPTIPCRAALLAVPLAAADTSAPADPSISDTWLHQWDADRAWTFAPAADRIDPWYAYVDETPGCHLSPLPPVPVDLTARLTEARRTIAAALATHRWSDAISAADAGKALAADQAARTADQTRILDVIAAFRDQAEQGRAYDQAQADFAAQKIKVQGILWSDTGTRLAMIDGESRVLAIGDQLKDWSIAAIDSDRVVFRAHGHNHYEFTCYFGADAN